MKIDYNLNMEISGSVPCQIWYTQDNGYDSALTGMNISQRHRVFKLFPYENQLCPQNGNA